GHDMSDLPARRESPRTDLLHELQSRTPARVLVGRAGPAYRTSTQLALRHDHAAAVDAVHSELDPARDFGREFCERCGLLTVQTQATDKSQYLLRPDLGRKLNAAARELVVGLCPAGTDLQVVIGDGLSAAAVVSQVPRVLPLLARDAKGRAWTFG